MLVLQTNEAGSPTYQYRFAHLTAVPILARMLLVLAMFLGAIAAIKLR